MQLPARVSDLPEYPFPRLRALLDAHAPGDAPLSMAVGEPTHPYPAFVAETLAANAHLWGRYPPNEGALELRLAVVAWLALRYGVHLDPETEVCALNGTREGLFSACLALCPERKNGARPAVLIPNPFYQCYAAAALAAGAEPVYVNAGPETGFLPDFAALPRETLDRAAVAYMCSPANPQGTVATRAWWEGLFALAERHDFRVFADECYAEIWRTAPPAGALEAAADRERVLAFHSLSKRSNLAGLRSGFVAGGARAIAAFRRLRAYGGAPCPLPAQAAAAACWRDEAHVAENRALYARKWAIADETLGNLPGYRAPEAGFFLWIDVSRAAGDGEAAALALWRRFGVRVVPGAYFSRETAAGDPGRSFVRVALCGGEDETRRGLAAVAALLREGDG